MVVLSIITLRRGLEPAWARGAGKNWLEKDSAGAGCPRGRSGLVSGHAWQPAAPLSR